MLQLNCKHAQEAEDNSGAIRFDFVSSGNGVTSFAASAQGGGTGVSAGESGGFTGPGQPTLDRHRQSVSAAPSGFISSNISVSELTAVLQHLRLSWSQGLFPSAAAGAGPRAGAGAQSVSGVIARGDAVVDEGGPVGQGDDVIGPWRQAIGKYMLVVGQSDVKLWLFPTPYLYPNRPQVTLTQRMTVTTQEGERGREFRHRRGGGDRWRSID